MTALTPATASRTTGLDVSAASVTVTPANGDTFPAGDTTYLRLITSGADVTPNVVFAAGGGPKGTTLAFSLPANGATADKLYGPFPADPFADATGTVTINYTGTLAAAKVKVYKF